MGGRLCNLAVRVDTRRRDYAADCEIEWKRKVLESIAGAIPAGRRSLPRALNLLHVPRLARSPAGRWTMWHGVVFYAWPLLSAAARLYRRTAVAGVPLVAVVGSLGKSTTAACVSSVLGLRRAS